MSDSQVANLPRFQLAARHGRLLKLTLVVCVLLITGALAALWLQWLPGFQVVLMVQIAAWLVLCSSLQYLWWISRWRMRALKALDQQANSLVNSNPEHMVPDQKSAPQNITELDTASQKNAFRLGQLHRRLGAGGLAFFTKFFFKSNTKSDGDTLTRLTAFLLAGFAVWLVFHYWNVPLTSFNAWMIGQIPVRLAIVILLLTLAFSALVLERHYAQLTSSDSSSNSLPEAAQIAYQLRVYISISLLCALALLLADESRPWPMSALVWISLLPAAIAVEFLLRIALSLFSPPRIKEPELLAKSFIAECWRWPIKPFSHFQDELKQRFGIDLRQSWAFAYIRRSLVPVMGVLLGIAWLFSSLVEIPLAERGIYERFGAPVAVWQPGIHVGLPWPMGRVQVMENGVVHELSATLSEKETSGSADAPDSLPGAEDASPAGANRLWDASHRAEKSQVIASEVITAEGNRQSFHIVNMDVRFMYRIGLSDSAALNARYTSADAPALIRSTANRILVRYFAARTLEGVLGAARTQMAKDIGSQLQADLDRLNSGVEIMSTVLEAIHPPAAAANAYHGVQAAQIKAQAIIARERGKAAQEVNTAQMRALIARSQASALARETIATAEAANRRFTAERDAYQQGGKAFLMEQYFSQLTQGLSNARLLVVDHRLPNTSATIDLRDFSSLDKSATPAALPARKPTVDFQELP